MALSQVNSIRDPDRRRARDRCYFAHAYAHGQVHGDVVLNLMVYGSMPRLSRILD